MKKLLNLKGAKMLSKSEQKSINGGITKTLPSPSPFCQDIFQAADCCNPKWDICFPYYSGYCWNGSCVL